MNRLRILLIGAALITGGSALASAQTLQTEVAYHDQYRDRYHDDRRFDNRYRDQRVYRDYRFDHDRRYEKAIAAGTAGAGNIGTDAAGFTKTGST